LSAADWKGRTVFFMCDQSALACLQSNGPSVSMARDQRFWTEERFALGQSGGTVSWCENGDGGRGTYDVAFPEMVIESAACKGVRSRAIGLKG
jgi:hypothetical protein